MVVRYVSHKALPHSLVAPEGAGRYYIRVYYIILYFIILDHIISYHIILYHIILYYIILIL